MVQRQAEGVAPRPVGAAAAFSRVVVPLSDALDWLTEAFYVAITATFATVMLLGVFFRYVLNRSLSWSDELALILFVWATFLAATTGYRHDKHVNIDFLVRSLSARWQYWLGVLAEGLVGGYLLCLLVSGMQSLEQASRIHTDALQVPRLVPFLSIPTASAVMLVHWIRRNLVDRPLSVAPPKLLLALILFGVAYLPMGQYVHLAGLPRFVLLVSTFAVPLLIGVPVAFSLGMMATMYVAVFGVIPFNTGAMQIFFGVDILTLIAVPLLILSGSLMHSAGIAERLVNFAQVLVGRVRGGLATSNVVASFLFGDISGSAVSDTAAIGSLMIPEMKRRGYRADFCAALQGASGTLGMTAPLSITLLLYASAINASVSRLAAATIVPGLLVAGSFMLVAVIHSRRHGYPREEIPLKLAVPRTLAALPGIFALVLILGGILGGVFTPAEVGSILLFYVLLLSVFLYRTAQPKRLYRTVIEAGHISGMTLLMVSTSAFVGFVLARDLVSNLLVDTVSLITTSKYAVLLLVNVVFVGLGMILEAPAIIFGFMPSFMPLLARVGVDPVHWGVLFVINMGLGMLVPPVALNLFVSTSIAGVSYDRAVRAAIPFMVIMVVDMVLVAVFPQIPLMLPHIIFDYPIK